MSYVRYALLIAGSVLVVAGMVVPFGPSEDFGFLTYDSGTDIDQMVRSVAERSLRSLAWAGLVGLAGVVCLLGAVWSLPRRHSAALVVVAGVVVVAYMGLAVLTVSDVDWRLAVWVAGLGLLASLAIAVVAGQRAGVAWLGIAGGALLAWPALDLLEGAVSSATLAAFGSSLTQASFGVSAHLQDMGVQQVLLPATAAGGVILVVLACHLRRG